MANSNDQFERTLAKVLTETLPTRLDPPAPSQYFAGGTTEVAIAICRDAWKQGYNDSMEESARENGEANEYLAEREAGAAYRAAMPLLMGVDSIRDFIACVAYGVLIGAIPPNRSGQLLYAAQSATTLLSRTPKY